MSEVRDLTGILDAPLVDEELAWDHAMEISGSIYRRMKQLGLRKKDLAEKMGVSPARISRILKGEQSMTLATLARLETALEMDMSQGFSHPQIRKSKQPSCTIIPFETLTSKRAIAVQPATIFMKESQQWAEAN